MISEYESGYEEKYWLLIRLVSGSEDCMKEENWQQLEVAT